MSKVSKKVANWLYTVLQPQYLHTETAYRDIYRFLAVYMCQGFKIRTAVYTSPSGRSELLVNLHGSLPSDRAMVPLSIWVPLNYPFADSIVEPQAPNGVPIVFFNAPEGHVIRPGNHVDSQGCVYHPFLQQWHNTNGPQTPPGSFDLIALMNCLASILERSSPIAPIPPVTGPALPPKPTHSAVFPQTAGGFGERAPLTGPPLPNKPASGTQSPEQVPMRYRSPLPLPVQSTSGSMSSIQESMYHNAEHMSRSPTQSLNPSFASPMQSPILARAQPRVMPQAMGRESSENVPKAPPSKSAVPQRDEASIEDLMDKVTLESEKADVDRDVLERLARQINEIISPHNEGSINNIVQKIGESANRTSALHSQLSHFNFQAETNVENLDRHITYLREQVTAVEDLNRSLVELERENQDWDELYVDLTRNLKIKLDDVVMADSALVKQLYDTTADIKAHKDAIKLVSGNYGNEAELVDGSNLEACMKAVRSLSRDLFWLEIMRDEIAKKMGLHT